MKIKYAKGVYIVAAVLLFTFFVPLKAVKAFSYPYPDTYSPGRQKTLPPTVDVIMAGDRKVSGEGEKGALIKVYNGDGYSLGTGYAYDGYYSVATKPLKAGETIQVYAHSNLKDESIRTIVYVEGQVAPQPSNVSALPMVESIYSNSKSIRGSSSANALIELYNEKGYYMASTRANSLGDFEFSISNFKANEILQFYVTEKGKEKTPEPLRVSVIDNTSYKITIEENNLQYLRGTSNYSGYVHIKDLNGVVISTGIIESNGAFKLYYNRAINSGETIILYAGRNQFSTEASIKLRVESTGVRTRTPVVYDMLSGQKDIKGMAEANALITIDDALGNELGRGYSDKSGQFTITISREVRAEEKLYIYAKGQSADESEPALLTIKKDMVKSSQPLVDSPKHGFNTITGVSNPFAKISVEDGRGIQLGHNWAGESGKFTVILNRKLEGNEQIKVNSQGKDQSPSDYINLTVAKVQDTLERISYIKGYPNGNIRPGGNLTRAEAAAMFGRLINNSQKFEASEITIFPDANHKWYSKAVNYMVSQGYMKGYPGGKFMPEKLITRAEFAQMIAAYDVENSTTAEFADVMGHWAKAAIDKEYGNGRLAGYPDGTFRPNVNITRAEAVKALNALFNRKTTGQSFMELKNPMAMNKFRDVNESFWGYYELLDAANNHSAYKTDVNGVENWVEIKN